ncbi:MAG: hypothetical protein ACREM2_02970 [Vulcanimicrobiaceae bacterium]
MLAPGRYRTTALFALAAVAVAGCGGSKGSTSAGSAGAVATTEAQRESAALPMSQMRPITIRCPGDTIVWVNLNSKAYHLPGDPYYGRTKSGEYQCKAAADAAGDHPAGARHRHAGGSTSGSAASDASSPSDESSPTSGAMQHHHRRHRS